MRYEIDKQHWSECLMCNKSIQEIKREYGGKNCYFIQAFKSHVEKEHNTNISDYFETVCKIERPICVCGICNQKTKVSMDGAKVAWRRYKCGRNPGQQAWSEEAKTSRKGSGNPMFGKEAWNKGLTAETSESMRQTSIKHTGKFVSEETRQKLREALAKRTPPHTGHKHSEETKEFLRQNTLRLIKEGVFNQTDTKPVRIFKGLLEKLEIKYERERVVEPFAFDFYLEDYDLYVEIDGDYFHSHPGRWPNGPVSKTQKINWHRDIKKNQMCEEQGLHLVRFWEKDVTKNLAQVEEKLQCILKESSISQV